MTNRTDTYIRADSTTTPNSPSDAGGDYTIAGGTDPWGILSNFLRLVTAVNSDNACVLSSGTSNVEVETPFQNGPNNMAIAVRYIDLSNFNMGWVADATTVTIYKRVSGSFTSIASTGGLTIVAGDVFKMRVDSSNLHTFYQNGISRATATDAANSTGTLHGHYAQATRRYGDGTRGLIITDIAAAGGGPIYSSGILVDGPLYSGRLFK